MSRDQRLQALRLARRARDEVAARLGVHLGIVEGLQQPAEAGQRRAQLVGDVGDELGAQLLVRDGLALVGQEDEGLARLADLVGLDGGPVGAAPAGEEAHLEVLARQALEAGVNVPGEPVLAERLEHRHARDQEREALERDRVGLDQAAVAVDPQGDERQIPQHLPAAALGDGELGVEPRRLRACPLRVASGAAHEDEAGGRDQEGCDPEQDQRDDHSASLADRPPTRARVASAPPGGVIGSPR